MGLYTVCDPYGVFKLIRLQVVFRHAQWTLSYPTQSRDVAMELSCSLRSSLRDLKYWLMFVFKLTVEIFNPT